MKWRGFRDAKDETIIISLLTNSNNGCDYIPNLGLLLGLGGGDNAGLPTCLHFLPCLAVSFVLAVTVGLVLWGRAGEALGAHDPGYVLLPALPGLCDSLWYYPIGLLLLVQWRCLHLMMRHPRCPFLWRGAWWGWRRGGRRGRRRAALHWGAEDPYLAARTISILSWLRREWEKYRE